MIIRAKIILKQKLSPMQRYRFFDELSRFLQIQGPYKENLHIITRFSKSTQVLVAYYVFPVEPRDKDLTPEKVGHFFYVIKKKIEKIFEEIEKYLKKKKIKCYLGVENITSYLSEYYPAMRDEICANEQSLAK